MLNQKHRKINIKNNFVERYYEEKERYTKAVGLRRVIEKHKVSPAVVRFNNEERLIEEERLKTNLSVDKLNRKKIQELAVLLKTLHSIKLSKNFQRIIADEYTKDFQYKATDIFYAIFNKLPQNARKKFKKETALVNRVNKLIADIKPKLCLIHGDVGPNNVFIANKGLRLIDWDDARLDLPLVDIYCLFHSFDLNSKQKDIFWKSYGKPDYWNKDIEDFFKVIHKMFDIASEQVTLIVPTYNRSPYKKVELNPLYTTIESFLEKNNKTNIINTVIISDDASSDHTNKTFNKLKNHYKNINFVYLKNKKRHKASYTRQKAIEKCPSQLLFMIDDDCIFPENFVLNAYSLFKETRRLDRDIAILNFPYVNKRFEFNGKIDLNEYCKVDYKNHWVYHNLDKYPKGVTDEFIKVDTLEGIFLGVKDKILDAGGYEDLKDFLIDYAEHISITKRITDAGYSIYTAIGKKYLVNHLKYGDFDPKLNLKDVPKKYASILKRANQRFVNSGDRLSSLETLESFISSFTYFYFTISEKEGKKHIKKEIEFLVKDDNLNAKTIEAYKKGINTALEAAKKRGLISQKKKHLIYMNRCIQNSKSNLHSSSGA